MNFSFTFTNFLITFDINKLQPFAILFCSYTLLVLDLHLDFTNLQWTLTLRLLTSWMSSLLPQSSHSYITLYYHCTCLTIIFINKFTSILIISRNDTHARGRTIAYLGYARFCRPYCFMFLRQSISDSPRRPRPESGTRRLPSLATHWLRLDSLSDNAKSCFSPSLGCGPPSPPYLPMRLDNGWLADAV